MPRQWQKASLILIAFAAILSWFRPAMAEEAALPLVHSLFCDHMVLQRGKPIPVWGWAAPGSDVVISLAGQKRSVTTSQEGGWRVNLKPLAAGGPHVLEITSKKNSVTIQDVLVGDVWLCSGQSNMEMPVHKTDNAEGEIAAANHPGIRHFKVARNIANTPQQTVEGSWEVCSPATVGKFSAAGYYFGRKLNQELGVPIGLIHSSWGGTPAEAWTSAEALSTMPDFRQAVAEVAQPDDIAEKRYKKSIREWWSKCNSPRLQGYWRRRDFDDTAWKTMVIPNTWEVAVEDMKEFDGIVRFRRSFELSEADRQGELLLSLGRMNDVDTTWVNGHRVGGEGRWDTPRRYPLPAEVLKSGRNVIAVRVCDMQGSGGMYGEEENYRIVAGDREISLAGDWKYEVGKDAKELSPIPPTNRKQNGVAVLYNGMIAPLVPFGIRGTIWYQGESNAGRAEQYARLLPTLIADWRNRFGNHFPFFVVQLANFRDLQQEPVEPGWAEIRESQQTTADNDSKVGLVVITDIGLADDVHPTNKQEVGNRLALSALAMAHDRDVVHASPTYREHVVRGNEIRILFDGVGSGLAVHGENLKGFAIAGAEGDFVWADARVEDNAVVVWAKEITHPHRVRYNWASNPIGNLFNQEGLPAACFRTDAPE